MAIYETDEEQAEAIKKWFKENGLSVITGIVVGLTLLGGWRWWQDHSTQQAQNASAIYERMLFSLEKEQTQTELEASSEKEQTERTGQYRDFAGKLLSEYSDSPYAVFAVLNMARQDLEEGDIDSSHARLQWVIDQNSSFPELTHIARLRKARLFLSQKKWEKAKTLINVKDKDSHGGPFKESYAELRGDIAVAEGELDVARTAYAEALEGEDLSLEHREWVQMKLDDLGPAKKDRIEANTPLPVAGNPSTAQDRTLTVTEPAHSGQTEDAGTSTITEPVHSDHTENMAPLPAQE